MKSNSRIYLETVAIFLAYNKTDQEAHTIRLSVLIQRKDAISTRSQRGN